MRHLLRPSTLAALAVSLGVGLLIGMYFLTPPDLNGESELRFGLNSTSLTNPLLECEIGEDTIASRKEDFGPELDQYVADLKRELGITNFSVYYRDLNNGPISSVERDAQFAPASLLKVPVLISYLKWSEEKPGVLDQKITYDHPLGTGYRQEFIPEVPLVAGQEYTARELLESMVQYSDNQALMLLVGRLPSHYLQELYDLLGVDADVIVDPTAELTIREYSIFFRILFNASFLSRTNSEYALGLLTQTKFTEGLRDGVPEDIRIAHKFGERKIGDGQQQFHDCGIVYYPDHPYLLCIMTRGSSVDNLIQGIARTSAFVYEEIDAQYHN